MKVFKFGGVSIKEATAIGHVAEIIQQHLQESPLVVVVSAMGKTTNALEAVLDSRLEGGEQWRERLDSIEQEHIDCARTLLQASPELDGLIENLHATFDRTRDYLSHEKLPPYDYTYDQVVSCGELASSFLMAACLAQNHVQVLREDIRQLLITDHQWQKARPNMRISRPKILGRLEAWKKQQVVVLQGFLGGTPEGHTTTLGREGSDYTAALLANVLEVAYMTVWKDVPGVLNADPKKVPEATLLPELSFEEAIEMTYMGARVLHPQTIQPLQEKGILLHVRSFIQPQSEGTIVGKTLERVTRPIIIIKEDQILVELTTRDLTFINERHLSHIFHEVAEAGLEVHLMQTSAVTFSMVVDRWPSKIKPLKEVLSAAFVYEEKAALRLITVRHSTPAMLEQLRGEHKVWFEQSSDVTTKLLVLA